MMTRSSTQKARIANAEQNFYNPVQPMLRTFTSEDYDNAADGYSSSDSEHDIDLREPIIEPPRIKFDEACIQRNNRVLHNRHSFFNKITGKNFIDSSESSSRKNIKRSKKKGASSKIREVKKEEAKKTNSRVSFHYESAEDDDSDVNYPDDELKKILVKIVPDASKKETDEELEERIFKPVLNIPPRRVHGFKNAAQYTVFYKASKNKSGKPKAFKRRLAEADDNSKFSIFDVTEQHLLTTYGTAEYFWNIMETKHFKDEIEKSHNIAGNLGIDGIKPTNYLFTNVFLFMPNGMNIDHFKGRDKEFGWEYRYNPEQTLKKLPLRCSGQLVNFYEPFVIRFKTDDSGRRVSEQGLCPYCPVDHDYEKRFCYDNKFFNLRGMAYDSHLAMYHGVYASGNEMPIPVFVEDDNKFHLICNECHRKHELDPAPTKEITTKSVLDFFQHCTTRHFHRKIPGLTTKQFAKTDKSKLLYGEKLYAPHVSRNLPFKKHLSIMNGNNK